MMGKKMKKLWVVVFAMMLIVGCSKKQNEEAATEKSNDTSKQEELVKPSNEMPVLSELEMVDGPQGMKYSIINEGDGAKPQDGQTAVVHYTLWNLEGRKIDSSVDRGQYFKFPVNRGRVIRGWDMAVSMMKIGETRVIILPPELAYGARGAGAVIPPNATLVFKIELFSVE